MIIILDCICSTNIRYLYINPNTMTKLIPRLQQGKTLVRWEDVKKQNDELNQLSDFDKIVNSHYKPKADFENYEVKSGDNLSELSQQFGTDLNTAMRLNNIKDPNLIQVGQKLKFPKPVANVNNTYKVKQGDNLSLIAKNNNVDINDLIRANKLKDPNVLQVNQSLNIPTKQGNYVIIDKQKGQMFVFRDGENKPFRTYEVGVGKKAGDAQTTTKIINGKTDWDKSNFNTGAGVYQISNVNPKSKQYYNVPSFNMTNDRGIEVGMAIHAAPKSRWNAISDGIFSNNKVSTGCINGNCEDMEDMYNIGLGKGDRVYVLPEDKGNYFEVVDGKPVFRSKSGMNYDTYVDDNGQIQKGQGINQSVNTLNYHPIEATIRLDKQNEINLNYTKSLVDNKQKIMQAAQIPSDVYNEIAKVAFGVLGVETNFGEEHSAIGNFARAVNKFFNPTSSSSPDYKSKFNTYGAKDESNSVGLTQLRFSYLNQDEKNALKKVGITNNEQLLDPENAAIATMTVLGIRYNQQLDGEQKKDIMTHLPSKWNIRQNYADRVKNAAEYLMLKQYMKQGGKLIPRHQQGSQISYNDPRYKELYNKGLVMRKGADGVLNAKPMDEFVVEAKDDRVKEGIKQGRKNFALSALNTLGAPQEVLMDKITGTQQTPSQAWGFNTEGKTWYHPKSISNLTMDVILDPVNLMTVGTAGLLTKGALKNTASRLLPKPKSLTQYKNKFSSYSKNLKNISTPKSKEEFIDLINESIDSYYDRRLANPEFKKRLEKLGYDPKDYDISEELMNKLEIESIKTKPTRHGVLSSSPSNKLQTFKHLFPNNYRSMFKFHSSSIPNSIIKINENSADLLEASLKHPELYKPLLNETVHHEMDHIMQAAHGIEDALSNEIIPKLNKEYQKPNFRLAQQYAKEYNIGIGDALDEIAYQTNPLEIHSRIGELRTHMSGDVYKYIPEELEDALYEAGKISDLSRYFTKENLRYLFNKLPVLAPVGGVATIMKKEKE